MWASARVGEEVAPEERVAKEEEVNGMSEESRKE